MSATRRTFLKALAAVVVAVPAAVMARVRPETVTIIKGSSMGRTTDIVQNLLFSGQLGEYRGIVMHEHRPGPAEKAWLKSWYQKEFDRLAYEKLVNR